MGEGQDYEELEKQLKEVFKERSTVLRELTKTSRELDGIKVNLQSLKNDEQSSKTDVQKLLELGQKQREEMKSLQEALQNQLKETSEKAEKHQATINFLKTEVERKSKMIRDLQNENKSLKNKLLSGSKLCGIHAKESEKIQAQLKELRYGKKDLLFKAQQLTELEKKLAVAKHELEKAALDKESQMKAMKETVQLCLTSVFRDQPPPLSLFPSNPSQTLHPPRTIASTIPDSRTKSEKDVFMAPLTAEVYWLPPWSVLSSESHGDLVVISPKDQSSHALQQVTDEAAARVRQPMIQNVCLGGRLLIRYLQSPEESVRFPVICPMLVLGIETGFLGEAASTLK
ncbi:leucine zipper protein 2-like [Arvicola amphibius]|uniref:leucine zipper protein 2-like n=1 Tax=Arvicola amphibius TaxID=1047088 RepID=UPI001C09111C|nr:leucine zipper protein 2-like [Arvicola amphibius]